MAVSLKVRLVDSVHPHIGRWRIDIGVLLLIPVTLGDHLHLMRMLLLPVFDHVVVGIVSRAWSVHSVRVTHSLNDNWKQAWLRSENCPLISVSVPGVVWQTHLRIVPSQPLAVLWFRQLLSQRIQLEGNLDCLE